MAEHYCQLHQCPFSRKENSKGVWWAHKKSDGGWCNESQVAIPTQGVKTPAETISSVATAHAAPTGEQLRKDDRNSERSSIEALTVFKGLVELLCAGVVKLADPLGQTVINYATSKMANWSSIGNAVEVEKADEEQDTPKDETAVSAEVTIKNLKFLVDIKKMTNADLRDTLTELGGKGKTITEMVNSLSSEALAKLNSRLAPLVPSRLAQEAIQMGAQAEATVNEEGKQ